jgi:hypothetical protein
MLFGYYDRTGYDNMYAGPENGGVCPLNNSGWGVGECPLSATHMGYDELAVRGHVDDYWYSYGSTVDPYYGSWTEHGYADCTADFMGTNQYHNWGNTDGNTTFWYYTSGAPLYDYTECEPSSRDGCHGMRLFAESRGYSVVTNYTQLIYGYGGNTLGFTFSQFKAEIDAGRPVLIQVVGHTMLGYGYDDTTSNLIYIHDTWDYSNHTMTWGGYYSDPSMLHWGVTVFQVEELNTPPNAPTSPLCEGVTNPTEVTDATPEFSWTFSDPDGGDTQGAYQILVASTSENLTADNGDMWDSGKVSSSTSEVSYAGTDLADSQTYYWKVKTWDSSDAEGAYCGQQQFTMGVLSHGLLRVQTSPAVPTTIYVDGIPRNDWGLDWVKMPVGEYMLSFSDVTGYVTPTEVELTYYPGEGPVTHSLTEPIMIYADTVTEVIVNFTQLGNLWVETSPAVQTIISLDGSTANSWGFWTDLLPGDYNISVTGVVGYATPVEVEVTYPGESAIIQAISDPIAVSAGGTTHVVLYFAQLGNLWVETSPALQATIFLNGNPMNDWSCWVSLEPGDYTVSFEEIDGYITPDPVVVTITAGATTHVIGEYVSE